MKLSRSSKIFLRYLPGPLLMVVLCWIIWLQLGKQDNLELLPSLLEKAVQGSGLLLLIGIFLLMLLNWLIESIKWKIAIASVQTISLFRAFKAVLSGLSFSVSLPNRIGEYVGRVLYLDPSHRVAAISVTVVSSFSQLIVTVAMGLVGWIAALPVLTTQQPWLANLWWWVLLVIGFLLLVLLLLYFKVSNLYAWLQQRLLHPTSAWSLRIKKWLEALETCTPYVLRTLLSLSLLRYGIFLVQYFMAYQLFLVPLSGMDLFVTVSLSFLTLAVVPTFAIAEIGLRGAVGIWIAGWFVGASAGVDGSTAGILLTALLIWITNLILPALVGALLMTGVRNLFNIRDEAE